MEITVEAKDSERVGKILSNSSNSRKVWGIKMFNVVYAFKRESFMHIVDCAQLHEKEKIAFFTMFVCVVMIYFPL